MILIYSEKRNKQQQWKEIVFARTLGDRVGMITRISDTNASFGGVRAVLSNAESKELPYRKRAGTSAQSK